MWLGRRSSSTKCELQSLLGSLNHAASVIGPGRTFLRGLISRLPLARAQHHYIRLNAEARADLQWWLLFADQWNGVNYLPPLSPSAHLVSDASGAWGCGAYWVWFQLEWPEEWQEENIATKELVPIVVGVALWGASWQGLAVACHCDNMAVVSAINSGRARYPPLNRLLRCLFFFTAHFKVAISAQHIPGSANAIADAISRNKPIPFHPQGLSPVPFPLPAELKGLLLNKRLIWSSPNWRRMFSDCLAKVLPQPLPTPTLQLTAAS